MTGRPTPWLRSLISTTIASDYSLTPMAPKISGTLPMARTTPTSPGPTAPPTGPPPPASAPAGKSPGTISPLPSMTRTMWVSSPPIRSRNLPPPSSEVSAWRSSCAESVSDSSFRTCHKFNLDAPPGCLTRPGVFRDQADHGLPPLRQEEKAALIDENQFSHKKSPPDTWHAPRNPMNHGATTSQSLIAP